jgi:hypothetical protein
VPPDYSELGTGVQEIPVDNGGMQYVAVVFPSVDLQPNSYCHFSKIMFAIDENADPACSSATDGQAPCSPQQHLSALDPVTVRIYGQANPFPVNPTVVRYDISSRVMVVRYDISSRVKTTASILWDIPPSVSGSIGHDLLTPDISPIINEVVSLPGWRPGNPLGILIEYVRGNGSRWAEAASVGSGTVNNGIRTPALAWSTTYAAGWLAPDVGVVFLFSRGAPARLIRGPVSHYR